MRQANFPIPLTSFIGRESEIGVVLQLLSSTRLLTLTGSGGVGKTRLAIQIANIALSNFKDGGCWVDLASLTDSRLVPKAVAKSLGIYEAPNQPLIDTITTTLRPSQLLLVLDNCEHLIASCAELAEHLLNECPGLKILTTSREELGVFGETTWHVPSLPFLGTHQVPSILALQDFASTRLFIERAAAVKPGFAVTDRNAFAIAHICQKLDGIPLAIELAAARIRILSAEEIAKRLVERFNLLTTGSRTALPRQHTLRASIDWSYELLAAPERLLFRCLSVFADSFTLEAAEVIAPSELHSSDSNNILDHLTQLVSKSLINVENEQQGSAGETRYRMLETIREYACEKLAEAVETEDVHARFLEHYLSLAEKAKPGLINQEQVAWLNRLEVEHNNLNAALEWSLENKRVEPGAQLTLLLSRFWILRGYFDEGGKWLDRILAMPGYSDQTRAKLLLISGYFARAKGNYERAIALSQASLAIFEEEKDISGIAEGKALLGMIDVFQGKREQGIRLLEESLETFRNIGDEWQTARTLLYIADTYNRMGKNKIAATLSQECLSKFKVLGDPWGIAFASGIAGEIARQQGNYREAKEYFRKNLILRWQGGQIGELPYPMETLSIIAIIEKNFVDAVRLWGAAEAFREQNNIALPAAYRGDYQSYLNMAREALGETVFLTIKDEGRNLNLDQAIALALQDPLPITEISHASKAETTSPHAEGENMESYGLTAREVDVLRLVAAGMTDAQVAERLFLSTRTISKHLQSIYNKLGVNSRTAATRIALQRHLKISE